MRITQPIIFYCYSNNRFLEKINSDVNGKGNSEIIRFHVKSIQQSLSENLVSLEFEWIFYLFRQCFFSCILDMTSPLLLFFLMSLFPNLTFSTLETLILWLLCLLVTCDIHCTCCCCKNFSSDELFILLELCDFVAPV